MPDRQRRGASGRHAGVIAPLSAIASRRSWGIGEIADLPHLAGWLASAGLDAIQLLPVNEMAAGQRSPYSALSAMAIDPIYIAVDDVPELSDAGGRSVLAPRDRDRLEQAAQAPRVQYEAIREIKDRALGIAFAMFEAGERSARSDAFLAFVQDARWWLDDYSLFRALHEEHGGRYWQDWPAALRNREPAALDDARGRLAASIRRYQYLQWIAEEQWRLARQSCGEACIIGDFPFMVTGHSADVWARQGEFRLDASVGVPSGPLGEGQDWGLPVCRWDVMAHGGYQWFAERTRRCAALFDGFRVDHLVGFYRTYARERSGVGSFSPPDQPSQMAQGEALLKLFRSRCPIIAEDLGVVPDFVRESQQRLGVPGLKVLRWERDWNTDGQPFREPLDYPACSVAVSGTHDTESLAEWWDRASPADRAALTAVRAVRASGIEGTAPFTDSTRDALLQALLRSGSDLVLIVLPDLFGWRDRMNDPAAASDANWTWRLPWPVDQLMAHPSAVERAAFLRSHGGRGRAPG